MIYDNKEITYHKLDYYPFGLEVINDKHNSYLKYIAILSRTRLLDKHKFHIFVYSYNCNTNKFK